MLRSREVTRVCVPYVGLALETRVAGPVAEQGKLLHNVVVCKLYRVLSVKSYVHIRNAL